MNARRQMQYIFEFERIEEETGSLYLSFINRNTQKIIFTGCFPKGKLPVMNFQLDTTTGEVSLIGITQWIPTRN